MGFPSTLHLFCRVVDNFGDIGVCWRLASQLQREHAIDVTLWVDDLPSFHRICSAIDQELDMQYVQGVVVRGWHEDFGIIAPSEVADVVIEAFACDLPPAYLAAMAARERKPVWLNLEYLSAESWVEGCHAMASPHPSLPLTKYFFFPGFSSATGGLLVERDLPIRREKFQSDLSAGHTFLAELGICVPQDACKVSLFCYSTAPVASLLSAMQGADGPVVFFVPEGVATTAVEAFLKRPATAGACVTQDALTLHVLPFIDQPDYDKLLWACDLNFVRGEDSFVRAQLAARPFVWHIYPQEDDAHRKKLEDFLQRYTQGMNDETVRMIAAMWHAWNGMEHFSGQWRSLRSAMPELSSHAIAWSQQVLQNGDLATNLVQFVREIS